MSRVWTILITMMGILLLLQLAGLGTVGSDGNNTLLKYVGITTGGGNGFNVDTSELLLKMGLLFGAAVAGGIILGYFTKSSFEWAILAPFAAVTGIFFASSFSSIISNSNGLDIYPWVRTILFIIFAIGGFAYLWALIEWVFNRQ